MDTICSRCSGTKEVQIPDTGYLEGYKLVRCGCAFSDLDLNIPLLYRNKTFDTFDFTNKNVLRKFIWRYIDNFELTSEQKGLLFYGGVGTGKTHLATATLKELARIKGIKGKCISYLDLLDLKRKSIEDRELVEFIEETEQCELLVLDDLGTERDSGTGWVEEQTGRLIDLRYRNGRPTIVTTNYPLINLKARFKDVVIGFRVISRLAEMCLPFDFTFLDWRVMK